jgi:hypothetical protein
MTVKPPAVNVVAPPKLPVHTPAKPPAKRPTPNGNYRAFNTPSELWDLACDYFEWVKLNPLQEAKVFCGKDGIEKTELAKVRAMTHQGFRIHISISGDSYHDYKKHPDYREVFSAIDDIIWEQKFTGAAAGLLNPAIIARELGLKESTEISGPNGGPIESIRAEITHEMDAETAAEIYRDLMK